MASGDLETWAGGQWSKVGLETPPCVWVPGGQAGVVGGCGGLGPRLACWGGMLADWACRLINMLKFQLGGGMGSQVSTCAGQLALGSQVGRKGPRPAHQPARRPDWGTHVLEGANAVD